MSFLTFKALHIVAVVAWFAGLFYIVRLFVYITEAQALPESERKVLLGHLLPAASRLWLGITWPAAIATLVFGGAMIQWFWPPQPWFVIKLCLVGGLVLYHLLCHWLHRRLQAGDPPWTGRTLRIWNEVATLFLVTIVFTVVLKDSMVMIYAVVGFVAFAAALMAGINVYRRIRER